MGTCLLVSRRRSFGKLGMSRWKEEETAKSSAEILPQKDKPWTCLLRAFMPRININPNFILKIRMSLWLSALPTRCYSHTACAPSDCLSKCKNQYRDHTHPLRDQYLVNKSAVSTDMSRSSESILPFDSKVNTEEDVAGDGD
jgi:hypothetical protein